MQESGFNVSYRLKVLPYSPFLEDGGLLYIAPSVNTPVGEAVEANHNKIEMAFADFAYLPTVNNRLLQKYRSGSLQAMSEYLNPKAAAYSFTEADFVSFKDLRSLYLQDRDDECAYIVACLNRQSQPLKPDSKEAVKFAFFILNSTNERALLTEVGEIRSAVEALRNESGKSNNNDIRFRLNDSHLTEQDNDICPADRNFDICCDKFVDETVKTIRTLNAKGINAMAVYKKIGEKLSAPGRLFIDKDYRIWLPDFGNKEVVLYPASKAVFFLFLRHPEGIMFKNLPDYKDELLALYSKVGKRELPWTSKKTVKKLVDCNDNSINVKCSRIKCVFLSMFHYELAQWYFIDGDKGNPKTIRLPRELVTWEVPPTLVAF